MLQKPRRSSFRQRFKAKFCKSPSRQPLAIDGIPPTNEQSENNKTLQNQSPLSPIICQIEPTTIPETVTVVADRVDVQDDNHVCEPTPDTLSTSEQCWNEAYNLIESDPATQDIVAAYIQSLSAAFGANLDLDALNNSAKRFQMMRDFVEEARIKLSETSTTSKVVHNVLQFIDSIKTTIGSALSNVPQATLPWAGVCIVVQVRLTHSK